MTALSSRIHSSFILVCFNGGYSNTKRTGRGPVIKRMSATDLELFPADQHLTLRARQHCADSADPAKHLGPFKRLYRVEHATRPLLAEECLTCGSTVVRKVKKRKA